MNKRNSESIYYHFLDRELRESIKLTLFDDLALDIVAKSMFMSLRPPYASYSHLWESNIELPKTTTYLRQLDICDIVQFFTNHRSLEDFVLSRQILYANDQNRYPMYFHDSISSWGNNVITLNGSTTDLLRKNFLEEKFDFLREKISTSAFDIIKGQVPLLILGDQKSAITIHLFDKLLNEKISDYHSKRQIELSLRMFISEKYTQRYLNAGNGTIITDIPQLQAYDFLANNKWDTSYKIYKKILDLSCFPIEKYIEIKLDPMFPELYYILKKIANGIGLLNEQSNLVRARYNNGLGLIEYVSTNSTKPALNITDLLFYYDNILNKARRLEPIFMEVSPMDVNGKKTLLVVVTTITELRYALKMFRDEFTVNERTDDFGYYSIITLSMNIYIIKSQMGLTGPGASIMTLSKAMDKFKPDYIIMGGIAFGANPDKQKIGDVLIASQIWNYEIKKVNETKIIPRGDKTQVSTYLRQISDMTAVDWTSSGVHIGVIASGETLVNSKDFINTLKEQESEIIGGDMESAGLITVAIGNQVDCIMVKAICDWGYDKTDENQELAAFNSMKFIIETVKKMLQV
ncbi:hypothetical protein [Desulfosporosinus sp. Sb-LF]|uniref:5'-methylthioadenosine/S-adenosylhomocysteine nucleosidase family protein n=1 Tax=Desulfosporosinus sp. Sb-LF TaxID=2560027 RepID=UPI00107F2D38|nr:hypothetical protein [Desulfosporosinus sp. Sb-LF]